MALAARGIDAYQSYATADAGLIAYETPAREGLVLDEHILLEIVRPGTDDPLPDGEVGEVVVTVLNPGYPLVRFGTGDLSAILAGPCPTGRSNTRIKGWLGRADQTAKVRGMFVHAAQVAELAKRHPEVQRARLVVEGEMANDRMTLHAEVAGTAEGLAAALAGGVRELTKLRCEVRLVAPGTLPNDGRVIEDARQGGLHVGLQRGLLDLEDGVQGDQVADGALGQITAHITQISDMNIQVATATEEQNSVTEELNRNIAVIHEAAIEVASGADQTASACLSLSQLAEQLQGRVAQFQL